MSYPLCPITFKLSQPRTDEENYHVRSWMLSLWLQAAERLHTWDLLSFIQPWEARIAACVSCSAGLRHRMRIFLVWTLCSMMHQYFCRCRFRNGTKGRQPFSASSESPTKTSEGILQANLILTKILKYVSEIAAFRWPSFQRLIHPCSLRHQSPLNDSW